MRRAWIPLLRTSPLLGRRVSQRLLSKNRRTPSPPRWLVASASARLIGATSSSAAASRARRHSSARSAPAARAFGARDAARWSQLRAQRHETRHRRAASRRGSHRQRSSTAAPSGRAAERRRASCPPQSSRSGCPRRSRPIFIGEAKKDTLLDLRTWRSGEDAWSNSVCTHTTASSASARAAARVYTVTWTASSSCRPCPSACVVEPSE